MLISPVLTFQSPEVERRWFVLSLGRFSFLFFSNHVFIVTVQQLTCRASYGLNKTSISKNQKTNESL